jgi:hypothetical protein
VARRVTAVAGIDVTIVAFLREVYEAVAALRRVTRIAGTVAVTIGLI